MRCILVWESSDISGRIWASKSHSFFAGRLYQKFILNGPDLQAFVGNESSAACICFKGAIRTYERRPSCQGSNGPLGGKHILEGTGS